MGDKNKESHPLKNKKKSINKINLKYFLSKFPELTSEFGIQILGVEGLSSIDLFSLGGLFSHCRPRDDTLEDSCFQILK